MGAHSRKRSYLFIAIVVLGAPQGWCYPAGPEPGEPAARFTFVLSDRTVLRTTYTFASNRAVRDCHVVTFQLEDVSANGPLISTSQADRAMPPIGTATWTVGGDGGPSPRCSNSFDAHFLIGERVYTLEGEVVRRIEPWKSAEGPFSAAGAWSRSADARGGSFKFYDYERTDY